MSAVGVLVNFQKARCIVQSWLMSWGVPYENHEGSLVVEGKTATFGPGGDVEVDVDAVLSKSFERSMSEMKRLMARFGRSMPDALRAPPARRARADDLLARSMKLTAFSKAPNPPEELMKRYTPIVKREADRAWRRFSTVSQSLLLEPGDYFCVGMVFLTIYLHRYQDLGHESRNRANLTLFLQQEFNHWDKVLHHDLPSLSVDPRGLLVEQFMQAPVPGATVEWWNTWAQGADNKAREREPSYTMPEYVEPTPPEPETFQEGDLPHHLLSDLLTTKEFSAHVKRCPSCAAEKVSVREARERHQKAKEALADRLDGMQHDDRIEALAGVMENVYCDPEARELAAVLFRKHMACCESCTAAWWAWDDERAQRRKYMTKSERAEAHSHSLGIGT